MTLVFGDPESIAKAKRPAAEVYREILIVKLIKKIRCPFCKGEPIEATAFDEKMKVVEWQFKCVRKNCPNSAEVSMAEEKPEPFYQPLNWTDHDGKFVNHSRRC